MAKSRVVIDRNTIERFLKEKRGEGTLLNYKPWLLVQEVTTHGKASRDIGWKTGRKHDFLSTLEFLYYLTLEWSLMVTDIREQFPLLPIEDTLTIADSLGLKHPTHPKTKEPIVMTTDFYISLRDDNGSFEHARTIKYAEDLSNRRTLEKFEIERRYWEVKGIDWGIVTENEIPTTLAENVDFLHDAWHLPLSIPVQDISFIAGPLTELIVKQGLPLNELTTIIDKQLSLEDGTSLRVAYYLLATRQWSVDMNVRIDPDQPLAVLRTDWKTEREGE